MPNPKRRHSNTRTRKRRTHDIMTAANTSACPQCAKMNRYTAIPPHRVCPECGFYRGRQVIQVKTKEKKRTA
jgi:large subunit ribosomal protein L32